MSLSELHPHAVDRADAPYTLALGRMGEHMNTKKEVVPRGTVRANHLLQLFHAAAPWGAHGSSGADRATSERAEVSISGDLRPQERFSSPSGEFRSTQGLNACLFLQTQLKALFLTPASLDCS